MTNKYYKNFLLCGEIDYYCLLCKETFHSIADMEKHIRWDVHRKIVKDQCRSPKFKKDVVYTIGDMFYCEICNHVEIDVAEMNTHLAESIHQANKARPKPEGDFGKSKCSRDSGYIIVSNVIVEARHWHGIVGRSCLLCGIDFANVGAHVKTFEHILNLIKSEVVIADRDKCYRKIRNDTFYCFICKIAMPLANLDSHWTDKDHCAKTGGLFRTESIEDKKLQIMMKLIMSQSDFFNVNFERGAAACKSCVSSYVLDFNAMLKHRRSHENNVEGKVEEEVDTETKPPVIRVESPEGVYCEVQDHGKRRKKLSLYGKDNFITLNPGGGRGYCTLCHTNLSGHLGLFKEHVDGCRHRGFLESIGVRKPSKVHTLPDKKIHYRPLGVYLSDIYYSEVADTLWLNKKFCVDVKSFVMVSDVLKNPHKIRTKCFACNDYYPQGEDLNHYMTEEHKKSFLAAKVLTIEGEFIREIRPDIYHCGYCNKLYPYWEWMEKHLLSNKHAQEKKEKDMILRLAKEWFDNAILTKVSQNPDVFYVQLINLNMFKSYKIS